MALLWLACSHHKIERFLDAVWKALLGDKTVGPTDVLMDKFLKWWEENVTPEMRDIHATDDNTFQHDDPFWSRLHKDVADLYAKLTADGTARRAGIPRGDYALLWDLIMVSPENRRKQI